MRLPGATPMARRAGTCARPVQAAPTEHRSSAPKLMYAPATRAMNSIRHAGMSTFAVPIATNCIRAQGFERRAFGAGLLLERGCHFRITGRYSRAIHTPWARRLGASIQAYALNNCRGAKLRAFWNVSGGLELSGAGGA